MNALSAPFRQLVDRKLWPLAILLIAALAAIPMLLAKDDVAAPAPITGAVTGATSPAAQSPTQPIVSLGEPAERESSRKVLGARKNPFEPTVKASKPAAEKSLAAIVPATGTGTNPAPGGTPSAGAQAPTKVGPKPAPARPVMPVAPVNPAPKLATYDVYGLKLRFGSTSADSLDSRIVRRLTAFPRMADPVLVYLGIKKDRETVVFLVGGNTRVISEGKCLPSKSNCQNVELKRGHTTFVELLAEDGSVKAQYQLDIAKVLKETTTDASAARAWRVGVAKGGREALRENFSRLNGWEFNRRTGFLIPPASSAR